jgi:hypothetical protein
MCPNSEFEHASCRPLAPVRCRPLRHRISLTLHSRKGLSNRLGEPEPVLVPGDISKRQDASDQSIVIKADEAENVLLAHCLLRLVDVVARAAGHVGSVHDLGDGR